MDKLEYALEKKTHKILWDFQIKTARNQNFIWINKVKQTWHQMDFFVPADYRIKIKEREKLKKYLDFTKVLKKL